MPPRLSSPRISYRGGPFWMELARSSCSRRDSATRSSQWAGTDPGIPTLPCPPTGNIRTWRRRGWKNRSGKTLDSALADDLAVLLVELVLVEDRLDQLDPDHFAQLDPHDVDVIPDRGFRESQLAGDLGIGGTLALPVEDGRLKSPELGLPLFGGEPEAGRLDRPFQDRHPPRPVQGVLGVGADGVRQHLSQHVRERNGADLPSPLLGLHLVDLILGEILEDR